MRVAIIGTGYVGLTTAVCLSEIGHYVTSIDINEEKITYLLQGISPIYEPGLEKLLAKNALEGRLKFTTSYKEGLEGAEIIIIAVGTPAKEDGGTDLTYLVQAAKDISTNITHDAVVVIKSTVPVGTNEYIKQILMAHCNMEVSIEMVSNPEFLRQGSAIEDTMRADRIIIGAENKGVAEKIKEMYSPLNVPVILTNIRSAEMIKYASNAFLATKISFINQIAVLCEVLGADVEAVATGMGKDKRIGEAFLQAGIGFGGSCFPKDVKSLIDTANQNKIDFSMLKETLAINTDQQERLVAKALNRFGNLKDKKIAMLGLAFKPETDDMREAPSIKIANSLTRHGAVVAAYDPIATENAKKVIGDKIIYASSVYEAALEADAVFIVTEWPEFKELDLPKLLMKMKKPIIFDGRNCMEVDRIRDCDFIEYYPVGKPSIIIGLD